MGEARELTIEPGDQLLSEKCAAVSKLLDVLIKRNTELTEAKERKLRAVPVPEVNRYMVEITGGTFGTVKQIASSLGAEPMDTLSDLLLLGISTYNKAGMTRQEQS